MGWRDDLQQASFRGVPFLVENRGFMPGRRAVSHEFPLRESGFAEDLGKKTRAYSVRAYVIGDDYMGQRDALVAAIETPGPGTYVDPYLGPLTVQVFGECVVRESVQDGRMASIEINFIDAGSNPSPVSQGDTQGDSETGADGVDGQLGNDFGFG